MSKEKTATATKPTMREGFVPEESRDVELSRAWYQPEPGSVIHFLPLRRSDDVRELFPPTDPKQPNDRAKHLWLCELMGPAMLFRDQEPFQGNAGDVFLMFEPNKPGIRDMLRTARDNALAVTLINEGKKSVFLKRQGTKRDVWQYKARINPKPFAPLSNVALLSMPTAEDAAKAALPEKIRDADETGE